MEGGARIGFPRSAPRRSLRLLSALLPLAGCQPGQTSARVLSSLDGLQALTYDGYDVRIVRAPDSALALYVFGQPLEEAYLRAGAHFVLTDGRAAAFDYEILVARADRVTLKRVTTENRKASGEGLLRREEIVDVRPYDEPP